MVISAKLSRSAVPRCMAEAWCSRFRRTTDNSLRGARAAPQWIHTTMLTTKCLPDLSRVALFVLAATAIPVLAAAQSFDAAGTRAQSMGGAFVAVADDATATWWNPAGLGGGPLLSTVVERGHTRAPSDPSPLGPGTRNRTSGFALAYPAMGLSYYRFRVSDLGPLGSIVAAEPGRQDEGIAVPVVRSVSVSAFGITVGQSLGDHLIVASTLRLLRAGALVASDVSPGALDRAEDASVPRHTAGDIDLGAMVRFGTVSLGGVLKHVGEPGVGEGRDRLVLRRQARVGAALRRGKTGAFDSLIGAVDLDVTTRRTVLGDQRRLAVGGELGLANNRVLLRGGLSTNTVGVREWQQSTGASVAVRAGFYVDGAFWPETGAAGSTRAGWSVSLRTAY